MDARTGRKLNNAVTLTFRTSPEETIAVGAQVGSAAVLLGFKNTGDAGRFTLQGPRRRAGARLPRRADDGHDRRG
ncbi:MAG: hypothetical protein QOJ69_1354 [Actinomycetota bacterium]|nr:hypothetical protein [Actinomycetota bacterium]